MNKIDRLPRKTKKRVLGKKVSRTELKAKVKACVFVSHGKTMYERPKLANGELFCPKCGCEKTYSTGNMVIYPEHCEYFQCLRCSFVVAQIDNSPFIHVLEQGGEWQ